MNWLIIAYDKLWFYVAMIVIGVIYGLGGVVHAGNMLGFGEMPWSESPLAWKIGDVVWGMLDIVAVIGILLKSPVGIFAVLVAAVSQIVIYGIWPEIFALQDEHYATLRGLVWFHVVILVIMAGMVVLVKRID